MRALHSVIVLGAGSLGSALGALLSEHVPVTLVGRDPHMACITREGLKLGGQRQARASVTAITLLKEIPERTLLVLTMKRYDVNRSLQHIARILRPDTTLLCLQNGIGVKEEISKTLSEQGVQVQLIRGVLTTAATSEAPGQVTLNDFGKLMLEETPWTSDVVPLFKSTGIETHVISDMKTWEWKKMIFNCITNPLTALFNIPNKELINPHILVIQKKLCSECLEVARREGLTFQGDLVQECNGLIATSENISSMLQDVRKGKVTEIDTLNGTIVRLAKKHGIPALANELMVELIHAKCAQSQIVS